MFLSKTFHPYPGIARVCKLVLMNFKQGEGGGRVDEVVLPWTSFPLMAAGGGGVE